MIINLPLTYSQISFGSVDERWNLGATAVWEATIYFGNLDWQQLDQIVEIAQSIWNELTNWDMATILSVLPKKPGSKRRCRITTTAAD